MNKHHFSLFFFVLLFFCQFVFAQQTITLHSLLSGMTNFETVAKFPRADSASSTDYNTFTRTLNLDRVPFTKAFSFDMEMLSWTGGTIDAAATTYWYDFKGANDSAHNK